MNEAMTLYELNNMVRGVIEDAMDGEYWVCGELVEGGKKGVHFYGELVQRDDSGQKIVARAKVNCWANVYRMVSANFERQTGETLRAGLQLLVCVRVTFHEQYGYSLNIIDIDPSYTLGDMAQRRRMILAQLEADGILHDNQELKLPMLCQRIAIVSSATAAGYGDFCNQLQNNEYGFAFQTKLFPAVMQGQHVEESVLAALSAIADEADKWDCVVIIRGGGAVTDLSDFDSYALAACIAQFPLPVLTGIGHERDETVLDFVAHTRLKTPTAVASFLIDRMTDLLVTLDDLQQRLTRSASMRLEAERRRLEQHLVRLPLLLNTVRDRNIHRLERLEQRMQVAASQRLEREHHSLTLLQTRLQGLDPERLLKRGYTITLCNGHVVRSMDDIHEGETLTTRTQEGEITSKILSCKKK